MARWYWYDDESNLMASYSHPPGSRPIATAVEWLSPDLVSELHVRFSRWTSASMSPGPVIPHRLWIDQAGVLAVRFPSEAPVPLPEVGAGEGLAQWLVLLSKWMEIHVVLARARPVWTVAEIAAALPFTSPSMLPRSLVQFPPDNWDQVAQGMAAIVADGSLPSNRQEDHRTGRRDFST